MAPDKLHGHRSAKLLTGDNLRPKLLCLPRADCAPGTLASLQTTPLLPRGSGTGVGSGSHARAIPAIPKQAPVRVRQGKRCPFIPLLCWAAPCACWAHGLGSRHWAEISFTSGNEGGRESPDLVPAAPCASTSCLSSWQTQPLYQGSRIWL